MGSSKTRSISVGGRLARFPQIAAGSAPSMKIAKVRQSRYRRFGRLRASNSRSFQSYHYEMRVAIVGGPGIGKSTLVRQLGDLYHNGSYGEGEKGVWDPRVLEDISTGSNPVGVTAYFGALYDANYRDAADNDRPGKVIFFEGARITLEAHIAEYPRRVPRGARKVLAIGTRGPGPVIVPRRAPRDRKTYHAEERSHDSPSRWCGASALSTAHSAASRRATEHDRDRSRRHGVP